MEQFDITDICETLQGVLSAIESARGKGITQEEVREANDYIAYESPIKQITLERNGFVLEANPF